MSLKKNEGPLLIPCPAHRSRRASAPARSQKINQYVSNSGSYYIYNNGEAEGMADWGNWTWTLDISDMTWMTTMPCLAGRRVTVDQAEEIAITSGYGAVARVTV